MCKSADFQNLCIAKRSVWSLRPKKDCSIKEPEGHILGG